MCCACGGPICPCWAQPGIKWSLSASWLRRRQDDLPRPTLHELATDSFQNHFAEVALVRERIAVLAQIDGPAIEHAGDVERADPVTGGLYGVLPTQGGMMSRLLRIIVSASNTN